MNNELNGLDEFEEISEEKTEVISIEEHKKKRKSFHFWEVNGRLYKMKLQTSMISKLENKYRKNLLNIISDEGIPPLSVMLTIAQAALIPWEHGIKYQDVEKIYDSWVEHDGGSQTDLLSNVIIPTMAVSGFFTPEQADSIMSSLDEAMNLV